MNRMRSNEGSQAALCRGFVATVLLMAGGEASAQVPVDGAYPMQTAPASACRLGDWQIGIGDPFIIASREQDPGDGTFVFPVLRNLNGVLFLNWHHDWDVLDGAMPNKPSGRLSRDGGITWKKQASRMPPGWKVATGPREITSYWNSFEIPGCPGRYRVATWRSADNGLNWDAMSWTEVAYPGTRGLDIYDPPEQYKQHSTNYKLGHQRAAPPPHMEAFFRQAGTRRRGPGLEPVAGADGALVSLVSTRYLPSGQATADEAVYWERLDWKRHAILMQTSDDRGRTWQFRGVVAHDAEHRVAEFDEEDCFTEPTLAIYPDGEWVCMMRTGSFKPLYLVRSKDGGMTWSQPVALPVRGVDPHLALLPNGLLALATGRPDCTLHFSADRGRTWPVSNVLFTVGGNGPGHLAYQGHQDDKTYDGSTCNVELTLTDDHTLLYVHDALRCDPDGINGWLKHHGFGRMVGRIVSLRPIDGQQ
jgi:hypothetical protein